MNLFNLLPRLCGRAKKSRFWLGVLNVLLGRIIPFNRPHGFRIAEIGDNHITTSGPYKSANQNHLRGIHACAIATVAEISAGFLLLSKLEAQHYRLIMSRIEVEYRYQAKEQIFSTSSLNGERIEAEIVTPLQAQDSVSIMVESRVRDVSGNEIAEARTTWQIKRWDRVQTSV